MTVPDFIPRPPKRRTSVLAGLVAATLMLDGTASAIDGARYLIICHDDFLPIVQPLAEWKTKKGIPARVEPVSQVGQTSAAIQAWIRNAYETWPVRPEYVLLVGSPDLIPSYNFEFDTYYGNMSGDYRMEIAVGRLPAENARECSVVVAKTLAYERPEAGGDTLWYLKGTTCVREDAPPDSFYQPDARFARGLWLGAGYTVAESLLTQSGDLSNELEAAVNDGRAFVTYRGSTVGDWNGYSNLHPELWTNGGNLPVVVAGTCATVSLAPGEHMNGDEFVRAGTVAGLGGAVAYYGTTVAYHNVSQYRGACYRGFFNALFNEGCYRLGDACQRGRVWVDSVRHGSQTRYMEWNLLGDPELGVWCGQPRRPSVAFAPTVPMLPDTFRLQVSSSGMPVAGANVCLSMDSTLYVCGVTDGNGYAGLAIDPRELGTMHVTVTGRDLVPVEDSCRVIEPNMPFLLLSDVAFSDSIGSGDSIPSPGELVRLVPSVCNIGLQATTDCHGRFVSLDTMVTVPDSECWFGAIEPGDTLAGTPLGLYLSPACREGRVVAGRLEVMDTSGGEWFFPVQFRIRAGLVVPAAATVVDTPPLGNGNGLLGPNETGYLQLGLANTGGAGLARVTGRLVCMSSQAQATDSLGSYGAIGAGETLEASTDAYAVMAGPGFSKFTALEAWLYIEADGGTYVFSDSCRFTVPCEVGLPADPTGPDAGGYYCYEDCDTLSGQAPVSEWLELRHGLGAVIPVVSDSGAGMKTVALPFRFRFYGVEYDSVTVCADGYLSFGPASGSSGRNRAMPDSLVPNGMIAPFWDDLNPCEGQNGWGTAYQYYDTARNRWLVEFWDFAHYGMPAVREQFQVALYDPNVHMIQRGNGDIEFQYRQAWLPGSGTVGIENQSGSAGIGYSHAGLQPASVSGLRTGRAIRFSTEGPEYETRPWVVLNAATASDSVYGNGNGLFEPGETLSVAVVAQNRGPRPANSVTAVLCGLDSDGVVLDSIAALGTMLSGATAGNEDDPFLVRVADQPLDTLLDLRLVFSGTNCMSIAMFGFRLAGVPPDALAAEAQSIRTRLASVQPSPARDRAVVVFALAETAVVELALYDPGGRRVAVLAQGRVPAGRHAQTLDCATLSQGVYFVRLRVRGAGGESAFGRKMLVAR